MKNAPLMAGMALLLATAVPLSAQQDIVFRQDDNLNLNKPLTPATDTVKILRSDTQQQINDYVVEVFTLRNARAIEILPLVLDAVRAEGGTASVIETAPYESGALVEASLDDKSVSYLQVVAPEFQIPSLRQMVQTLDVRGIRSESGVRYNHLRLANRNAEEVAEILRTTVLSPVGSVAVDPVTNTVYIEDSITDSERALATAAYYDVAPPQVEIMVNIIELEGNEDTVLGLEWDAWKDRLSGGFILEYAQGYENPSTSDFWAGNALVGIGGDALARFLNYMAEEGKAEIISRTTLTALNNEPATFSNMTPLFGEEYVPLNLRLGALAQVRYDNELINTAVAAAGANGDPVGGIAEIFRHLGQTDADFLSLVERNRGSEGIAMIVEPTIGADTVTLSVDAIMNSLADVTRQETPIISTREVSSRVNLKYGETLKLGSFDRKHEVKDERGIPLLKDIPYVGYLFKKEVTLRRDRRVVVFLTPMQRNNDLYTGRRLDDRTVMTDPMPRLTGDSPTTAGNAGLSAEMEAELNAAKARIAELEASLPITEGE